jgi:hypothetical protein
LSNDKKDNESAAQWWDYSQRGDRELEKKDQGEVVGYYSEFLLYHNRVSVLTTTILMMPGPMY